MNDHKNEIDSQSIYYINSRNNLVEIKSQKSFIKKYKNKIPIIFVVLFIITALSVAVVILSILYANINQHIDLCDNENCIRIAASLKESMNTSIDPCDDFYKYACGRWSESHPSLDLSQEYSWFKERSIRVTRRIRDLLLRNLTDTDIPWAVYEAKMLFTSCMDVAARNEIGLSPLLKLLNELNLPQIPSTITKNTTNFIVQMAKVKRILWTDVFFGTYILSDPKDNTKNIIVLDLPDRVNPFPSDKILEKRLKFIKMKVRQIITESDELDEEIESFASAEKIYMSEVLKQLISNGTTDQRSCKTREPFSIVPEQDIQDTINKLYKLSEIFFTLSNVHKNETIHEEDDIHDSDYILVEDLQQVTDEYVKSINETLEPKIIWKPFIQELLKGIVDFDLQQKILIGDMNYLKEVAVILASTDEDLLETAIWWIVVDYCVPYSSEDLRKIWNSYTIKVTGIRSDRPWSIICAENVNDLMGMAVSWLYINPSFLNDNSIDKVSEMLENIKLSFSNFVIRLDWMDDQTKLSTLQKNRKMKSLIGFPDWLFKKGELDNYYKGINISDNCYFDNMLQIIRMENSNELRDLVENEKDADAYWPLEPTEVNALHTFQENQIAIPAGILQFPFYGLGLEALNYGALGSILGHELTHGFDNSGRLFDSSGNFKQWWSNETISKYTNKTMCFINQYNKYYIAEVDDYINGQLTLGENIADNGGLREAYYAYQIWKTKHGKESLLPGFTHLTHDQLLFLSYAHMWCESYTYHTLKWMLQDSHCPGNVRLKMVLRNSKQFSKSWNCPIGSNMNPEKKCHLW